MSSTGIDRYTGAPLSDFEHVLQCVAVIFMTRIGEMVMLRWFGAGLPELLGRRATLTNLSLYRMVIALAINAWEPRLNVVKVVAAGNTADGLRLGELNFTILCEYRPKALTGDLTVEGGLRKIGLTAANDNTGIRLRVLAA
ncbi:GPW/gp25 family protein [Methylobacterium gnaphalii]|uniref:IraD/Gp25-like domain-containing protein n=1 Tax=Methylobacterium gnaphalii TaxID=1010610 RepID=A0A512JPD7_9HYPH|nr:GPW/gp25 family protein [Methylobacterium gnaphalii]GEP11818.1 hypothetical protein MGN01_36630 [Methylobacterium gnaphalii]GJD70864.1 hypothetical protein MMMDOFMJ_3817 [Methylobacterium gnaphalii]GLS49547.1 hypothetical protein GCM10007885_23960 [Methylobacterium gnaphalii]